MNINLAGNLFPIFFTGESGNRSKRLTFPAIIKEINFSLTKDV